jgi:hypothetical protein
VYTRACVLGEPFKSIETAGRGGACLKSQHLGVQGYLGLQSKFQASLGYMTKPHLANHKKKKKDIFVNPPTSNFIAFEQSVTLLTIH